MIKSVSKYIAILLANTLLINGSFAQQKSFGQQRISTLDNFNRNVPTVTIGGFVNANAGFRDQDSSFKQDRLPDKSASTVGTYNKMTNSTDFTNDSEIHFKVGGINEFGLKYGAVVELEADVSADGRGEGFNADKTYIFTESRTGKFEFGNNIGANQKMKVGPSSFARAAGGVNGKYLEYINMPMLADSDQDGITPINGCNGYRVDSSGNISNGGDCSKVKLPNFILTPASPVSHGGYAKGFYNNHAENSYAGSIASDSFNGEGIYLGTMEDATKLSIYTPRVSGWQLGVSYTPDTGNSGSSAAISGENSGDIQKVVSWGVNYSNTVNNFGFAISATGENGKFEQLNSATIQRNDLNSYEVGVMLTYFGFTIGGSYGNWGDSLQPTSGIYSCDYDSSLDIADQNCTAADSKKFDDSQYFSAGLAYEFGPVAVSLTHISSEFQKNEYSATSIGADYRMAKGLMPYIEFTQFEFESNHSTASNADQSSLNASARQIRDNDGYVILTGILFAF